MKCTFYRPETVNLTEYYNIIEKMECDLQELTMGNTEASEVYRYIKKLLQAAKPLPRDPEMCFWGMAEPESMPSDARCDFFYRPTYIATAFLMQAMLQYPELKMGKMNLETGEESVEEFLEVLPKAMKACTGVRFCGHGYDAWQGELDTMELFLKAGASEFVMYYPRICHRFTSLFRRILRSYMKNLALGTTKGMWGEDYTDRMRQTLHLVDSRYLQRI